MNYDFKLNELPLTGVSILIAEDVAGASLLLSKFMARFGADVVAVENGQLAYEACQKNYFDIVLMDIQMPVMDGLKATQLILQHCDVGKIIAVSAASEAESDSYLNMGFTGVHNKPVNAIKLKDLIVSLL